MNKTGQIILIAIMVLPWLGVLVYFLTKKRRSKKYYRKLQQKYEFAEEPAGKQIPVFSGQYRSRPVKVQCSSNGDGTFTELTVSCDNPANFEFSIVKRGNARKTINAEETYLTDDDDFDEKFIVHTNDLPKLKRLFDFNTRFKLQQVCELGFRGEIRLRGNSYSYIEPGLLKNDESVMRLELVLHELCDLADIMKYD